MIEKSNIENETKHLYFEDLAVGMDEEKYNVITDKDIILFSQVSGDTNPVHLNENYAAKTRFRTRIAHGSLCASFISAVIGTKLPGPGCIYITQNLRFKAPVRIGDEVITKVVIKSLIPYKNYVEIITQCHVNEAVVLDGEATVMVSSRFDA